MIQSQFVTRVFRKSVPAIVAAVMAIGLLASVSRTSAITMTWTNGNDVWNSTTAWTTNLASGQDPNDPGLSNVTCIAGSVTNVTATCTGGTGGFPGLADQARFTNNTSYTVTLNITTNVGVVTFSNTAGTVTMDAGANTLGVTNRFRVAEGGATSTVVWTGGTLSAPGNAGGGASGAASLQVGTAGSNSVGTLIVTNGTIFGGGSINLGTTDPGQVGRLVIGSGGVFTNFSGQAPNQNVQFRLRTAGSQLVITNGGKFFWCGSIVSASSNSLILVSGPGSFLYTTNVAGATVGALNIGVNDGAGPGSLMIVSNGATVHSDGTLFIGRGGGSPGQFSAYNTGIVVGAGSKLIISDNHGAGTPTKLIIGAGSIGGSHYNNLTVYDGGNLQCDAPFFAIPNSNPCTNNSFNMGGSGAMSTGAAYSVGNNSGSYGSRVVVSNAVFTCTGISVGGIAGSLQLVSATLDVSRPTPLTTNLDVGVSVATNCTISFPSGTLSTGQMSYQAGANNGLEFVVGDGNNPAYYDMTANGSGYHSFSSFGSPDFVVTNGAYLRGSGTLKGTTRIFGTFVPGFAGVVGSIFSSNSLTFGSSAVLNYDLGTNSDSVTIGTNTTLFLRGTLNVQNSGGFTATNYTLFTLLTDTTLTTNDLTAITLPPGYTAVVSNDVPNGKVLLVVTATGGGDPYSTWASLYGLSGGNAAGTADPDGDGMNNTNEFLAGFNPTNSTARLRITSIVRTDGTNQTITYLGASGDSNGSPGPKTNVLDTTTGTPPNYTNNYVSTGLTNILTGGTGLGQTATFVHTNGASGPARYYRVRVLVP